MVWKGYLSGGLEATQSLSLNTWDQAFLGRTANKLQKDYITDWESI